MKINFKRLITMLSVLSVCGALMLTGCQKQGTAENTPPPPEESAQTAQSEPSKAPEKKQIAKQSETSVQSDWSEVGSCRTDFNKDGNRETIALFVNAQKDGDEQLSRGDGQEFVLRASADGEYYNLFDEYVQNGNVYFDVSDYYNGKDTVPTITLIKSSGAEFEMRQYTFDKEKSVFNEETIFTSASRSTDGINRIYTSIPNMK